MRALAPVLACAAALPLLAAAADGRSDARARLAELNRREAELSARMGGNRTTLVRLLAALESVRRDPPPALLVRPDRARDAARAAILLQAVTPELQRRARRFAAEAQALRRVRREAAAAGAAVFAQESAAAELRAASAPARPRPGDLLPTPPAPEPVAGPPPARLTSPVDGPPALRFGQAGPEGERSRGWTWTAAAGAPVRAPASALVEHAGALRGRGLVAVLRLDGGWRVVLAGLRRVDAGPGARVRAGEEIGRAQGGELLLELRRGAEPADPGPALTAR